MRSLAAASSRSKWKAGRTGTLKSLHQFVAEKRASFAVRFDADLPALHTRRSRRAPRPRLRTGPLPVALRYRSTWWNGCPAWWKALEAQRLVELSERWAEPARMSRAGGRVGVGLSEVAGPRRRDPAKALKRRTLSRAWSRTADKASSEVSIRVSNNNERCCGVKRRCASARRTARAPGGVAGAPRGGGAAGRSGRMDRTLRDRRGPAGAGGRAGGGSGSGLRGRMRSPVELPVPLVVRGCTNRGG